MEVRSIYKYARISPFKVREVTREIQGLPVSAALDVLAFTPKKAAFLINKTLKSAIANAENNANLKADGLVVKEAVVGEGPTFKRMKTARPKRRNAIRKRRLAKAARNRLRKKERRRPQERPRNNLWDKKLIRL